MRLSRFIELHLEEILEAWESFAKTLAPATDGMDVKALRDHAKQILETVAKDIETPQTAREQSQKSKGLAQPESAVGSAASLHGTERHRSKFSMMQLAAEYRALRATVLRLWMPRIGNAGEAVNDMVRFNETIDQALAESIATFSGRAERAKDLFIATLSHDLRAPLASISSAGDMLGHPQLSLEQAVKTGARVSRSARLMSSMVDDLADYTRVQLGDGLQLTREHVDLRAICCAAIDDAKAMRPDISFNDFLDVDLEGLFDTTRIHRLLTNLLANAAQHGDQVAPVVLQARPDGDRLVLTVTNQGAAIPRDKLDAIFEPMVQLPAGGLGTQPRPGMGLGLYIARMVAEAHGGSISVVSEEGKATSFTVCLPRQGT